MSLTAGDKVRLKRLDEIASTAAQLGGPMPNIALGELGQIVRTMGECMGQQLYDCQFARCAIVVNEDMVEPA